MSRRRALPGLRARAMTICPALPMRGTVAPGGGGAEAGSMETEILSESPSSVQTDHSLQKIAKLHRPLAGAKSDVDLRRTLMLTRRHTRVT
jgi:hypothetical protein